MTGDALEVTGEVWYWRGPAPYHFVTVPMPQAEEIREIAAEVTYGWGMIPVSGRLGATEFTTSLWPKDGGYVVPLKDAVRRAEQIDLDDTVTVHLTIAPRDR
ncbi:DUF1905 domain-containing protein [Luteipulveratus halotolerans]|uniref:DUF1905 domain-containing protein n=1 Tax=Luteipulveratus halotolerans TaxID=1631356 RepID=A0A0L6CFA2_9MICO|nr:DUF1905 domain-containing protein [Luteipulveratus halotolerans]KNX36467.1 hypothetical protein VV01_03770 [Luteipulveratus halotolerans]